MNSLYDIIADDYPQILLMGGLLVLSATFSGSETALFSLKASDLNRLRRTPGPSTNAVLALHASLGDFLMTVLFCNMVVNILFFACSTVLIGDLTAYYSKKLGEGYTHLISIGLGIASLLLVITFGEVTPKSVASISRVVFCRIVALPMLTIHRGLWWVRAVLGRIVILLESTLGLGSTHNALNPEELKLLIEASRADGIISADEHDLITEVLELPDVRVRELMTPRVDVVSVPTGASAEDMLHIARNSGHSKLPVRDTRTDEYIGWIDARGVFIREDASVSERDRLPPVYVSELDRADQVLVRFRKERLRLAIVVDERGGSEGILTLNDLVGVIFGGLGDEDELPAEPVREVGENAYLLSGDVSVREWRTLFGFGSDLPSVATVGGLVSALLGRMPRVGDRVRLGNLSMEVTRTARRRVIEIRLTLEMNTGEDPE